MNDELYHHGILGQKWGVRRYQNSDGSLTALGRKRLGQKMRKTKYQDEERARYNEQFNNALKKVNGGKEFTGDGTEAWYKIGDEKAAKMWNDHLDKLASAKIKDLGIEETKQAKEYVNSLFEEDKFRKIHYIDGNGNETISWDDMHTLNDPEYKEKTRGFIKYEEGDPKTKQYQRLATLRRDKKEIKEQISKEITNDLYRWKREGDSYLKGKNIKRISNEISKQLEKHLDDIDERDIHNWEDTKTFSKSWKPSETKTISFSLGGFKDYNDYQPLSIEYDPESKKITGMWWL